jgi:hypothetical protein
MWWPLNETPSVKRRTPGLPRSAPTPRRRSRFGLAQMRSEVTSSQPRRPTRIGPAIGFVKPSAHAAPAAAASRSLWSSSVEKTPRPRAAGVVTACTAKAARPWLIRANDIASVPSGEPSSSRASFSTRGPAGFRSNHQSNSSGDIASP